MPRYFVIAFFVSSLLSLPLRAADSEAERLRALEKAVKQLQERNAELENKVQVLESKKSPFAPIVSTPEAKVRATSDGKSVVFSEATPPAVDVHPAGSEYKLTLGGYVQANLESGDVSAFEGRFGLTALKDRFRLRRARITLSGDFKEDFDFKIQGDFELSDAAITALKSVNTRTGETTTVTNSSRVQFAATDIYINWHHYPEANIKVGQYKSPFGLEFLTSSTELLTIERSLPTSALVADRQIGIMVWGKPLTHVLPEQKELLTYYAGVFNGNGRNINNNDNNEFMYVGRLELLPWKGQVIGQEAQLRLGGDYLYSRDDSGVNISPAGNLKVNTDGSLSSFTLASAAERSSYSFDAALTIGPFDLRGEYLNEHVNGRLVNGVAPTADFEPSGWYVQAGYFIVPKKLQVVSRFESLDPDQVANDNIHSVVGGLNYYIHGDSLKLMANYVHTWSDFRQANPQFGNDQFDEVLVRLQVVF